MRRLVIGTLVALPLCGAAQAQPAKPTAAIKTFENPANHQNSTIGNALTEILTTELAKTGKYRLLERQAADELLREIDFGSSSAVKGSTAAQRGGMAGAEYFLFGKVTNFSYQETAGQASVYEQGERRVVTVYHQQADVRVDFRLVRTKTGEILLSEAGSARNTNTSRRSEMNTWRQCLSSGTFTGEMLSSLIGRTSVHAVSNVVRKLSDLAGVASSYAAADAAGSAVQLLGKVKPQVLALISATEFVISAGRSAGLMKSDRMTVYRETVIKDSKGQEAFRRRKEVAKAELVDFDASGERAEARLLGPSALPLQEGDVVEVDLEQARALRGAAPAITPSAPGSGGAAPAPSSAAEVAAIIRQGDRYFEDRHHAQALEQYQKAAALKTPDAALLDRLASAHVYLGSFLEAETVSEQMLERGMDVPVPVRHRHSLGGCSARLTIRKGWLLLDVPEGDHGFRAARGDLLQMSLHPDGKWLKFRVLGRDAKAKDFDLLITLFAVRVSGEDRLVPGYDVPAERLEDHKRLLNLIRRLIQKYL